VCVGELTYGGYVVLVNGYMEVLCVLEWAYGGTVSVGEWIYGGMCVLVNGHMEVMCCW